MHLYHDSFPYQVMFGLWGLTNASGAVIPKKIETERNLDLENVIGNLLIAEYQVHRLKEKLANMLSMYTKKGSAYNFKIGSNWFNVTVGAERQVDVKPVEDPNPIVTSGMDIFAHGSGISPLFLATQSGSSPPRSEIDSEDPPPPHP